MTDFQILAFDLNGTLVGNPDGELLFKQAWDRISQNGQPTLCYFTGWLHQNACEIIRESSLPAPHYLISGAGTCIYDYRKQQTLQVFDEIVEDNWNLETIEHVIHQHPTAQKRAPHYQGAFKSSWHFESADDNGIQEIQNKLDEAEIDAVVEYSDNRVLDIFPRHADKGNALRWLLRHLDIPGHKCLVAGDTGNDAGLFRVPSVSGIVVGNAQPELFASTMEKNVYHAEGVCANGVVEGLVYYGLLDESPATAETGISEEVVEPEIKRLVHGEYLEKLSRDQMLHIQTAYNRALDTLRKNITPIGFSACSLQDNEINGTEENYQSVWARDGAICVEGTLALDAPDIRECQKNTLTTLLDHVSPNGQIPTNVRIHGGRPDYSGVGNICSIDSGLWTVIAFSEYVRTTRDFDFLRAYSTTLDKAMTWLAAQDGNNDALLEIPEAGDWTDLFGRSYNVLYDEVLWYYANFCYGRLLEFQGDFSKAGHYLRQSRTIKATILRKFWPTSASNEPSPLSFTELQASLGDTRYLLAQVTPFDFNWRCDIYGNLLAFLFNVMDFERAKQAFRFMWGVGVNKPYPVTNLYPVVSPGDRDWRNYYTVNLLNLPHHYHNGGVWPFIGAQWVRFINRLGFRDIALHELLRLAELNQRGIHTEWEFNEWAHGETGRPMGKSFQAWSAALFIQACQELHVDEINPD